MPALRQSVPASLAPTPLPPPPPAPPASVCPCCAPQPLGSQPAPLGPTASATSSSPAQWATFAPTMAACPRPAPGAPGVLPWQPAPRALACPALPPLALPVSWPPPAQLAASAQLAGFALGAPCPLFPVPALACAQGLAWRQRPQGPLCCGMSARSCLARCCLLRLQPSLWPSRAVALLWPCCWLQATS
jgi:hypothetical protein